MIAFQLQPALGGVEYSRETIERVTALDGVIAIKEASFDRDRCAETVKISAKPVLTGNDNFILESFELGCTGRARRLRRGAHCRAGRDDRRLAPGGFRVGTRAASARLQPIADALFAPPVTDYRRRMKELLVRQGVLDAADMRPSAAR